MPDRRVLIGLIVLAISARAAAVLVLRSHEVPHSTYEHGEIASNLLSGRGFSVKFLGADGPTSQQAPVYPLLVAGAYALGGEGTPRALLILELGQALLGGVLVGFVVMLAREVVPGRPQVAIVAGLIAAVHPTLVYSATHVQVASLATMLLAGCLAWAYRAGRTGSTRDAVAGGVFLSLLALSDPILGLVAPGMAWAIAIGQGWRRAVRLIALVGVSAALCVTPWVVRNARVHGEFVPIKSSFGYAFWQGNCSLSEGTDKVVRASVESKLARPSGSLRDLNTTLWEARHEAGYLDDIALTQADYRELGAVSEPERSRTLFQRALIDLHVEPSRYARLCLRRLRYFVFFDETNPKTRSTIYRVAHLSLTTLAALGLILARPEIRRRLGPTLLTTGLIATFHILTIVSARFHLPIEPLMALWAASGVTRWGQSAPAADDIVGVGVELRLAERC
jgi:Dolichyl-phosphate-mannose-protein mannosyltransferase